MWTNDQSPAEERAFERAADALNQALDRRVRVSIQMRVTACVQDTLGFVPVLRELQADQVLRYKRRLNDPRADWDSRRSFGFAAAVKATFYFARALQDAVYAALLEASGLTAGPY